jgi:hypothetical protein
MLHLSLISIQYPAIPDLGSNQSHVDGADVTVALRIARGLCCESRASIGIRHDPGFSGCYKLIIKMKILQIVGGSDIDSVPTPNPTPTTVRPLLNIRSPLKE